MSKVVGIDLGTTNSLVAYVDDGVPVVIRDASGDALVPSIVSIGEDGHDLRRPRGAAPSADRRRRARSIGEAVHGPRHRGRSQRGASCCRSRSAARPAASCASASADREFTPPEISAFVLRELKRRAEDHFREQRRVRLRGRPRRHHRAGVLQRRAAHGHARRRPARRPRGAAHHQRADRGVAGLRARQAQSRHDCRVRPRRRHVRHLDPQGRGRRVPGAGHQRRHASRRRRHRSRC